MNEGAEKLNDGSGQLASGLKDGAEETGKIKANEKNIGMFASPVELISNKVNDYSLYRDSTAPYVMTLALFVGILIMSMFIKFNKPQELNVSMMSWFAAKFLNLASLAVVRQFSFHCCSSNPRVEGYKPGRFHIVRFNG